MIPRIVIVGAGFVGTQSATLLAKRLGRHAEIVLIDPKESFCFTPRLIDALADPHIPKHYLERPLARLAKRDGFLFVRGNVVSVDRKKKTVVCKKHETQKNSRLHYEILVLCPGARTSFFDIPGANVHALPLKCAEDVIRIHTRADALLMAAADASDDRARRALLSFAVVGAGPSGVESLFALKQYIERWCRHRQKNLLPFVNFSLIHASPHILPGFSLAVVDETLRALQLASVNVYMGDAVKRVGEIMIDTSLGRRIPSMCTLWTAGIEPNTPPITPTVRQDHRGGVMVDPYLRAADGIFAAGDVVTYRERNVVIPKNAQTALLMSQTIAENIMRFLTRRPLVPFRYHSKGNIIYLGWTGVVDLRFAAIKTRFAIMLRDIFYRHRMRQIAG